MSYERDLQRAQTQTFNGRIASALEQEARETPEQRAEREAGIAALVAQTKAAQQAKKEAAEAEREAADVERRRLREAEDKAKARRMWAGDDASFERQWPGMWEQMLAKQTVEAMQQASRNQYEYIRSKF